MADGAMLSFGAQRNEDYLRQWRFRPQGETTGIDITGWGFSFRVKKAAGLGDPPLLSFSNVSSTANGSGITIDEATDGRISVKIKKEDIAALPGRTTDIVPFSYNLIATDGGGIRRADVRGHFIVEPGV